DQDWIAQVGMVEPELSSDKVGEGGLPRRHEQAHRKRGPARWRVGETAPGVLVGAALTLSGGSLRCQLLGRAEAAVGGPRFEHPGGMLAVGVEPLALPVRSKRAAYVRPFVPVEAKPVEAFVDRLLVVLSIALQVGVVDAQDEAAAGRSGEEQVEEGGP